VKPKLAAAVRDTFDAELGLHDELRKVGERHAAEHDVFHTCRTLVLQGEARRASLREAVARRPGLDLPAAPGAGGLGEVASALRQAVSAATGRTPVTGMQLLADLRGLYLVAAGCEIEWTILGQGAKSSRDEELIKVFAVACEEVVGVMRWVKTKIKLAAPQVLSAG
jgi:hypothetical protein